MSSSEQAVGMAGPSTFTDSSIGVSSDQISQQLQATESWQRWMDEKLHCFQEEVRQGQEDVVAKVLERVKYDKSYCFQQKGNEAQVFFNAKVNEALAQAESDIADIPPGLAKSPAIC